MDKNANVDRSIEDAGHALGKTPREIEQAKSSAHKAIERGEVSEREVEGTMKMVESLADLTRPDDEGNDGGGRL